MFDDNNEIGVILQCPGGRHQLVGVGHHFEHQVTFPQGAQYLTGWQWTVEGAHRAHPPETGCRHLALDEHYRVGCRIGGCQTPDDRVGMAVNLRSFVELEGLLNRMLTGGGGDIDHFLDVPARTFGQIRGDIEEARHA